ncbi:MAG: PAS domain-containing protein [Chloroflexaceae bacterium]|nr:PAS domain-containing protein [Chloroflexaceae bacterium]
MIFSLYLGFVVISVLVSLGFMTYALYRHEVPGALPFALLLFGWIFYDIGYICEILAETLPLHILWDNIQFTASDIAIIGYLLFALEYTHRTALARRLWLLLWMVAVVNALFVWTNPWHQLVRSSSSLVVQDGLSFLFYDYGPWFGIYIAYTYLIALTAIGILIFALFRASRFYQLQVGAILCGMIFPLMLSILTVSGFVPLPGLEHLDIAPISSIILVPLWAWALFHQRFLDIMPIARDYLIDVMPDAILVVDQQQRVVDSNDVIATLLDMEQKPAIGTTVADLLPFLSMLLSSTPTQTMREHRPLADTSDAATRWLEVSTNPLNDRRNRHVGWLVILRNRTEHWQMNQALRASEARYRALVESSPDSIFQT